MCAIAGVIGKQVDDRILQDLLETMKRRGPDGQGVYRCNDCAMLHTRLAIIDPAGGAQPMMLQWEGKRLCMVYNGELYNTEELRRELLKEGHHFEGHSDSEVVLHAYAQYGEACLEQLNGIYAFAIWDEEQETLFLARDRMGVKPLFYMQEGTSLLFASEIKTILACPGVEAQLDATGAMELLMLGPGRTSGCGVLKGIRDLRPGWCGRFQNGKLQLRPYWKLMDRIHQESFSETAEHVRALVLDAIRRQMVSDVPIGTFLSGGLDSSIITAVCANAYGNTLDTFSVDYKDNGKYFIPSKFQPNSDGYYIDLMQNAVKTKHHWTILTPDDLMGSLEEATMARDLPGMADVDFSLLAFCKDIRKHVKVALSGECADEIFGGYPWYRDPEIRNQEGFPWSQNISIRKSILSGGITDQVDPEDYVREQYKRTIGESDILPENAPQERRMKEMVNLNQKWFMQTLLDRKDRMSMHSGLEVRVPFCDHRIAEYLYGVPWEFKDYKGKEKGLLRYAMRGILPEEVLYRKKSPYPKTFDPRYLLLVRTMMDRVLEEGQSPLFCLVDREKLKSVLNEEQTWPWYGQLMKTPQTIAYFLQLHFWLTKYKVQIL